MVVRMVAMLILAGVVFGGVFGFNMMKQKAIAQYMASRPVPVVPVEAAKASEQDWVSTLPAIGFLEAKQGVDVSPAVAGLVVQIGFESGQKVKRGDLLVKLDSGVEEGQLQSAQAQLPAAQRNYDRYRALAAQGNAAAANVDDAQAKRDQLLGQIASSQATIERKTITAPFDGVLGIRQVQMGQYLQPGTKIVNLQDLSVMQIRFMLSQRDLSRVAVGQEVRIKVDAYPDRPFSGAIEAIEPMVNEQSGVVSIQASIPNADGHLRPGMFATLEVVMPGSQKQIVLPRTAVAFSLYGESVYVLKAGAPDKDGKPTLTAQRVSIGTGERRGDLVVVKSGVKPGDLVVTAGQLKLQNGTPVSIQEKAELVPPKDPPRQ